MSNNTWTREELGCYALIVAVLCSLGIAAVVFGVGIIVYGFRVGFGLSIIWFVMGLPISWAYFRWAVRKGIERGLFVMEKERK